MEHQAWENLNPEYERTIKSWIADSQKTQKEIAALTKYVSINPGQSGKKMKESTLTRTIGEIPRSKQRTQNLFEILAVLYSLNIITISDVEEFRTRFHLTAIGMPWGVVLKRFEEAKTSILNIDWKTWTAEESFTPTNRLSFSKNTRTIFIICILLFITLLAFLIINISRNDPLLACSQPYAFSTPTFVSDQGYSLFEYQPDNEESGVLSNQIRTIATNKEGLWVGYAPQEGETIAGVSLYNRGTTSWVHCTGLALMQGQVVNDFAFNEDENSVFIALDGRGIAQLKDNTWIFYTAEQNLPSNIVYDLWFEADGTLWAATFEGVARLDSGQWQLTYQAAPETLISNHVHTFMEDSRGNRWFGTINRGVSRLSNGSWHSYFTQDEGLQNIRDIQEDGVQGVWFATDGGGVVRFFEEQWTIFTQDEGLPGDNVQAIEKDHLNRIWVATDDGVAYTPDYGLTWFTHSTLPAWDLTFGCETCLDPQFHMWIAVRDRGISNVRIPPLSQTIDYISIPDRVQLSPGESYIFEVEVRVLSEQLQTSDGDSLRALVDDEALLYGAYPIIPYRGDGLEPGQTYIFSNIDDPIIAPNQPGVYQIPWRVWQGRRFVAEPIMIEFEVISPP